MKKIFLSFAAALTIGATTVFASPLPEANPRALDVFKKEFANAEAVKWDNDGAYSKVSFVLGGNRAIAFFNEEGDLLGSMRDLVYNQLPLSVITSLDKRFSGGAVYEIREVTNNEGTRYMFTVEEKNRKYKVTMSPAGFFENIEKVKK